MSQLTFPPTFSVAYGTDIFVGVFPDDVDVTEYRVLTGGPYRGAIGDNSTFGFWCDVACARCTSWPPCVIIPTHISLPKNAPIFIKGTIFDNPKSLRARFMTSKKATLVAQLDAFRADVKKPCGFHIYAITSPKVDGKQLLAIQVSTAKKKKLVSQR